MRAINLLPEGERPHVPSGRRQGSAYVVVGTLGVVLVALVSYVLVANQVTSTRAKSDQAQSDATAAEAKAARLGAFGSFAQVKQARETSVKSTATERFDWERLSREMARVIPTNVFVTELEASAKPDENAEGSGTGGAGAKAKDGPHVKLTGCAATQKDVATTMVRLRALHRAVEVTLEESARASEDHSQGGSPASGSEPLPGGAAPTAPTPASSGEPAEDEGCGTTNFLPNYEFIVHVAFEAKPPKAHATPVPAYLGGGS